MSESLSKNHALREPCESRGVAPKTEHGAVSPWSGGVHDSRRPASEHAGAHLLDICDGQVGGDRSAAASGVLGEVREAQREESTRQVPNRPTSRCLDCDRPTNGYRLCNHCFRISKL